MTPASGGDTPRRIARLAGHGPDLHRRLAGGRDRYYSAELFRDTAERIPNARLVLYQDRGHAGVLTYKPAIREIVAFLRADDQPRT